MRPAFASFGQQTSVLAVDGVDNPAPLPAMHGKGRPDLALFTLCSPCNQIACLSYNAVYVSTSRERKNFPCNCLGLRLVS